MLPTLEGHDAEWLVSWSRQDFEWLRLTLRYDNINDAQFVT